MSEKKNKAALLIGINYILDSRNRLNGCVNDVMNMASLLVDQYGFPREKVLVVADSNVKAVQQTTRDAIIRRLYEFAISSWRDNLEIAYFHYSGHGTQQNDVNFDEPDGKDEGICPCDFSTSGLIIDDDLLTIFSQFNPNTKVIAVFDCCHSGSILDLPYEYDDSATAPKSNTTSNKILPKIVMLSGCVDSDTSADAFNGKTYGGALTMALTRALTDGQSNKCLDLHKRVLKYIKEGNYSQRPVMASSFLLDADYNFIPLAKSAGLSREMTERGSRNRF